MLTPDVVRTAIILMKRAPMTGEETDKVSLAIKEFENMHAMMTAPEQQKLDDKSEAEDGTDP